MIDEIEQQVIAILLKNPNLIDGVDINADWFVNDDYRALFNSFSDEYSNSLIELYSRYASEVDQALPYSRVNELTQQMVYDNQLPGLGKQMRVLFLRRQLQTATANYNTRPTESNLNELQEALQAMQTLQTDTDDGSLQETADALSDRLINEQPSGIKTYPSLDTLLAGGLYGSMLFTIGARPSVGKTAFTINLCYEVMRQNPNVHIDFFTLEMNKREILNRFVSRDIGVSSSDLRNPANQLNSVVKGAVKKSADDLAHSNLRVFDKAESLGQITSIIRHNAAKAKENEYLAVIDYIGLVSVTGVKERYLEVGKITRDLKIIANELDVPIIALSQLSRGVENRTDKTPVLSDLRESGSIEQDSNVVAFLERASGIDNVTNLIVAKNREGSLGKIAFSFNGRSMHFTEVAHG